MVMLTALHVIYWTCFGLGAGSILMVFLLGVASVVGAITGHGRLRPEDQLPPPLADQDRAEVAELEKMWNR